MFIPYSIANPLTTVRIPRRLPRPGEILVRPGDAVEPAQVVAQAIEPADFCIVDVARDLEVPIKKVKSYLKIQRGDTVAEGDIIAERGILGGRACRAPLSGTVVGSGRGRLLIEADPFPVQLNALVPGIVVEVEPQESVTIETVGGFIQGAWGNGLEAFGILRVVVKAPQHPLRSQHINPSLQGAIIVGGASVDGETLERANEAQVRGIIVGGISPTLIPQLKQLDFPLITTEGLGERPMSQLVFELLRSWDGREAALSGKVNQRWRTERPFIAIPMPTRAGDTVDPEAPLMPSSKVRILRGQYTGVSGTVIEVPKGLTQLDTGARLPCALVDIGGSEQAWIPLLNLERLL